MAGAGEASRNRTRTVGAGTTGVDLAEPQSLHSKSLHSQSLHTKLARPRLAGLERTDRLGAVDPEVGNAERGRRIGSMSCRHLVKERHRALHAAAGQQVRGQLQARLDGLYRAPFRP